MFAILMGLKTVSPQELQRMIERKGVAVFDVNSPQSWMKAHVPGAKNLPSFSYTENDLPPDKTTDLVFYCSGPLCRKGPTAARRAKAMGYDNVRVMAAGINGWIAAALPTQSGE